MGETGQVEASAGAGTTTNTGTGGNYAAEGMTLAGGITSAYAHYTSGQYNKKVLRGNAAQARIQADQAIEAGNFAAGRAVGRERMVEGADASAAAAGGTVVGAGTNRNVIESNRAASAMDRMLIELNARRQAYGFRVKAAGDESSADMAGRAGDMGAASTLLNTGSQLYLESDPSFGGQKSGLRF